jgi:pyridinium-3,5-biscarboxylic acid mononucleotide synthase
MAMTPVEDVRLDLDRLKRTSVAEAVFSQGKSPAQIEAIASKVLATGGRMLFTRLSAEKLAAVDAGVRAHLDYDARSRTAVLGGCYSSALVASRVCIVAAGTSDLSAALEADRTLRFHGHAPSLVVDVGVAGLWRLLDQIDHIRTHSVVIAVAGMEGALFSVVAGLVEGLVIAVPTSVGYGVGEKGAAALTSALASCSPGIVTVNIDNGFGAAAAALKILRQRQD